MTVVLVFVYLQMLFDVLSSYVGISIEVDFVDTLHL